MALLLVVANMGNCIDCEYKFEWMAYYSLYNIAILRIFTLSAFISDILMIFNRYLEITGKQSFLNRLSKKSNLLICFLFPAICTLPYYFAIDIVKCVQNGSYIKKLNKFGVSGVFTAYFFSIFLIETVIPLAIHLFLNIVSIYKFKNLMERHANLTNNQTEARMAEVRFTKMVLLLSFITSVTRILDLIFTIGNRIYYIQPNFFQPGASDQIMFGKSLSNLIVYGAFALDALVYLTMDNNLWKLISTITGLNKVFKFLLNYILDKILN